VPTLNDKNREIWEWLFRTGGEWTAAEIGERLGVPSNDVFWGVSGMARRNLVKIHPRPNERRLRYGVDGTCLIPQGMHLGEVQA
jgi:hypothetical protein